MSGWTTRTQKLQHEAACLLRQPDQQENTISFIVINHTKASCSVPVVYADQALIQEPSSHPQQKPKWDEAWPPQ